MKATAFRNWFRDTTPMSRRRAAVAAVALAALLTWSVVPTAGPSQVKLGDRVAVGSPPAAGSTPTAGATPTADATPTAAGAASDPGSPDPPAGAPGTPGTPGGRTTSSAVSGPGDPRCAGLGASDQGVTAGTIVVGVGLIDLAGPIGNEALALRPDQEEIVRAVVDDINQRGGVGCRTLKANLYKINALDESDQKAKCFRAAGDDKVFAFLDAGGYVGSATQSCFTVQHRVPLVTSIGWTPGYYRDQGPYLSSYNAGTTAEARNWVFNAADNGFFDRGKGFRKLGLLYDDCFPEIVRELKADLRAIGLTSADIAEENLGCVGLIAPPSSIAQAALNHKMAEVSHVFPATLFANVRSYLDAAKAQDFHPVYGASDLYCLTCPSFTKDFDPDEWAGTVAYTASRSGDLNAGLPLSEATARCDAVLVAHGLRGVKDDTDNLARVYCDLLHFFTATMRTVPVNPTRLDFATAVPSVGRLGFGGVSDGIFNRPGVYTGADFQRPIAWFRDCRCWKVTDPKFRPGR